jgi:hypothetical protein
MDTATSPIEGILHTPRPGPEPWPTAETWRAEIDAAVAANDARLTALARQGFQIDQTSIINIKLATLFDAVFGDSLAPARLAFEQMLQERFTEKIGELEGRATQLKLAQGINGTLPPPGAGLIVPGR